MYVHIHYITNDAIYTIYIQVVGLLAELRTDSERVITWFVVVCGTTVGGSVCNCPSSRLT